MDINKMRPVRISPHASAKVMLDHFPTLDNEQLFHDLGSDTRDLEMSAGALCLYAATLLSKVYETDTEKIEHESSEREQALKEMIKTTPKYAHFTDDQVATMAHNMIIKDIRNSIAHGNFEISYDVYSKRLYYILWPRRKDYSIDKPIIISKESLLAANRRFASKIGHRFMMMSQDRFDHIVTHEFGNQLKDIILPLDMMRLAENYLDKNKKHYEKYKPTEARYLPLYYPLLVSQMTYEQDEYYNLFSRDSNMFIKIAHIRNAIAHNWFEFDNKTFDISHSDRDDSFTDPLLKSVRMLKVVRDHKNLVLNSDQLGFSEEAKQDLISNIKNFFDSMFIYGGYEEGDAVEHDRY